MMSWFLVSIKANISKNDSFTFITNKYFSQKFKVKEEIAKIFQTLEIPGKFEVLSLDQEYPGMSGALYAAKSVLETESPVTVICPDQYIDFELPENIRQGMGFLAIQAEFGNMRGYVQIKDGKIVSFAEKDNISNFGNCGVFIFSQGRDALTAIKKQITDKQMVKGEYYLGSALNYLINDGYIFYPTFVRTKYDLGNLPDINHFTQTPLAKSLSQLL